MFTFATYMLKAVTLGFVKRITKKRLVDLDQLGIQLFKRKQPFKASLKWCWNLIVMSGASSRKKGCKRSCPPEELAKSVRNFGHFIREKVLVPANTNDEEKTVDVEEPDAEPYCFNSNYKYKTLKRKMNVDAEAALPKRMNVKVSEFGQYPLHRRINVDQVHVNKNTSP